jgi:hypothetical protein
VSEIHHSLIKGEKSTVDMALKMKFRVNKYSQVFNRVGPGYVRLAKFININQYVSFPGGYNFSSTAVEFHTVSSAPTLYRVNVRVQYIAVFRRFDGSVDSDIVSKIRYFEWATASRKSLINTLKSSVPMTDP